MTCLMSMNRCLLAETGIKSNFLYIQQHRFNLSPQKSKANVYFHAIGLMLLNLFISKFSTNKYKEVIIIELFHGE